MRELPEFNGYTVDHRLREFRKLNYGELPEFIPFDSKRGIELLEEMKNEHELTYEQEDLIVEDGLEKWRR